MVTKEEFLNVVGEFTWMWGMDFFIETDVGNFIWKDPDYQGDNTIRRYNGSYNDYLKEFDIDFGRDKGKHMISEYCGTEFKLVV